MWRDHAESGFVYLKVGRLPSSTLFPYTTLFRSGYGRSWGFGVRRNDTQVWGSEEPAAGDAQVGMSYFQRSEEHTSELQSLRHLVCGLLLETTSKGYERVQGVQYVGVVRVKGMAV